MSSVASFSSASWLAIFFSRRREIQKNASSRVSSAIRTTTFPSACRPVRPLRWIERIAVGTGS